MAEHQVETERRADLEAIKRMIPHRDPFLLIDAVEHIRPLESAVGIKAVRTDEPFFEGHFPGEPIMPGVLIVEAMAQTAGVLVVDSTQQADSDLLVYFMGIDKARFRKRVLPGDKLELHVRIIRGRGKVWKFYGAARVSDDLVAEAEYSAMIITKDDPAPWALDVSAEIHPTAIVAEGAVIGDDVRIGPYCVIGSDVSLGDGVVLESHVAVAGHTGIGPRTRVWPFASLGHQPQDLKYRGEPTRLEIGADNAIREHVTMNPGTGDGGGLTRVGDRGLFMVGVHVGHDCMVGDDVILANNATLGGHVEVGRFAVLGGICAVHQRVRIGAGAMVGGMTGVEKDVIPYGSVVGDRARLAGLNLVGLKRRGTDRAAIHAVRACYRAVFQGEGSLAERAAAAQAQFAAVPEAAEIIDFILADNSRAFCTPDA